MVSRPSELRRRLHNNETLVMAVLNATPDSFSGDGLLSSANPQMDAARLAKVASEAGADIIDIGAVATFPGAPEIVASEESARLAPILMAVRDSVEIAISVDTHRAEVADLALSLGADMVNSHWGIRTPEGDLNESMIALLARHDVPVVLAHNQRRPVTVGRIGPHYTGQDDADICEKVVKDLREDIRIALDRGISRDNIVVDPGLGQGKTPAENIRLLAEIDQFLPLGYPVLIAASRKSFIGLLVQIDDMQHRDLASSQIAAIATRAGVGIIRTHDVELCVDAVRVGNSLRPSR